MMRVSREEELYIGRARTGMVGRAKAGFSKDGRITALDLFIVEDNGPYGPMGDHRSAANAASLIWQPLGDAVARRRRHHQHAAAVAAALARPDAGATPSWSRSSPRRRRSWASIRSRSGASTRPKARRSTARRARTDSAGTSRARSCKEALDRGAELFKWDERKARSGQREGTKVRGIGVAVGPHGAGSIGYDGLMTIRPDGKLYVQSGVGNLGTHSCLDLARVAADMLAMPWDKVVVNWGSTGEEHPVVGDVGRQPDDARDDAGESRRRGRRAAEAAGDCGEGSRRRAGRLQARRRARVPARQPVTRPVVRAGRRHARSRWAASTTATSCRTTSIR